MSEQPLTDKQVAQGLEGYVVYHGGIHDDDCPGDDTCECEYKPLNDAANEACRRLFAAAQQPQPPDAASQREAFMAGWDAGVPATWMVHDRRGKTEADAAYAAWLAQQNARKVTP
jgi:hypothetical protein